MYTFSSIEDRNAIEAEMPWEERDNPVTLYGVLRRGIGRITALAPICARWSHSRLLS